MHHLYRAVVTIALFSQAAPSLELQGTTRTVLNVGELKTSRLEPFESGWILSVDSAGRVRAGQEATERFEAAMWKGTPVWRLVQHDPSGGGGSTDLVVVTDRATFAPRYVEARDGRTGAFRVTSFEGSRVSTSCSAHLCPPNMLSSAPADTMRRVDTLAVVPHEYFAGSWGMLFAGVPLKAGAQLSLPVHHPVRGLLMLAVDVGELESIDVAGKRVMAWRVRTPQQPGFVYHITNAPPYWVRLEVTRQDGSRQVFQRTALR